MLMSCRKHKSLKCHMKRLKENTKRSERWSASIASNPRESPGSLVSLALKDTGLEINWKSHLQSFASSFWSHLHKKTQYTCKKY